MAAVQVLAHAGAAHTKEFHAMGARAVASVECAISSVFLFRQLCHELQRWAPRQSNATLLGARTMLGSLVDQIQATEPAFELEHVRLHFLRPSRLRSSPCKCDRGKGGHVSVHVHACVRACSVTWRKLKPSAAAGHHHWLNCGDRCNKKQHRCPASSA